VSELDPQRVKERFRVGNLGGAIADARVLAGEAGAPEFVRALAAVAAGEWEAGLRAAERALVQEPGEALALWCRGEARVGLGDRAGALADWSRIVEDDPDSRTAWKDLALVRALTGDRAGALADLAHVGRLSPDDVVPRLWRVGLGAPAEELEPFAEGEGWSARLAQLLLGRASADSLLAELADLEPGEQRRRRCQVTGYAGLLLERDGGDPTAHYRACAATEVWSFVTHLWARERLRDASA